VTAKRSAILSCSWTSPPEAWARPYIGKYLFSMGDSFRPGWTKAFFGARGSVKPSRRLNKMGNLCHRDKQSSCDRVHQLQRLPRCQPHDHFENSSAAPQTHSEKRSCRNRARDSRCLSKDHWKLSLLQKSLDVIPAEAGIQVFRQFLDPGLRRGDGI